MFQERGFSSSIATDQAEDATAWDGLGDIIERQLRAKPARYLFDFNDGRNTVVSC